MLGKTGELLWETRVHNASRALDTPGVHAAGDAQDLVVVTNARDVRRLRAGHVAWHFAPDDDAVHVASTIVTPSHVYVVAAVAHGTRWRPRLYVLSGGGVLEATHDLDGELAHGGPGRLVEQPDPRRGHALLRVDVHGDAAAVVEHGDGIVGVEGDQHAARMARQRLVDRVVDDLIDHVVQAGPVVGVADIHAGPLADGVEALQHPDRFRAIFGRNGMLGFGRGLPRRFSHVRPSRMSRISCA